MGLLYDALPDWMQEELTGLLETAPEKGNLYGWLSDQMPNPPGSYRGAIVPAITYDGKSSEWAVPGMVRDTALGWAELIDAAASPEKAMKAYNEGLSGDAIMSIPMLGAPQATASAMGKVPKGALGIFGGPGAKGKALKSAADDGSQTVKIADLLKNQDGVATAEAARMWGDGKPYAFDPTPVDVTTLPDGRKYLLNGYHRVMNAADNGIDEVAFKNHAWNDEMSARVYDEMPDLKPEPLPMDKASRMARAREMGFDVDAYHGTDADIREFDLDYSGQNAFADDAEKIFLTNNPDEASAYATGAPWLGDERSGGNVMPVKLRGSDFLDYQIGGEGHDPTMFFDANDYVFDDAISQGYGGVAVRNADTGETLYVASDPKNIRSRFAAFDPARKDSADLLAANPAPAALLGLLYGHDQYNSPIGSL